MPVANAWYYSVCQLINNSDLGYRDKFELRRTAWNMKQKMIRESIAIVPTGV